MIYDILYGMYIGVMYHKIVYFDVYDIIAQVCYMVYDISMVYIGMV